jgi:transportin-1
VVRWTTPSQQLNEMFHTILHGFREMSGAEWATMRQQLPEPIAVRLAERYNI